MIQTYCQYSYGGFKTFYIEGLKNEHLNSVKEVTLDNTYDFPQDAHVYFQYGGSKIVYRQLPDGHLCLAVREIPSNDTDGAGQHINCAVQFIGQEEDRHTLDNLALIIANDITSFSTFFADLFYDIKGLHIEGDKLHEFIDMWSNGKRIEGEMHPVLSAIEKKSDGVYLFVPLSDNFNRDKVVTTNVCKELRLNKDELRGSVIRFSELMRFQKFLTIEPQSSDTPIEEIEEETIPPVEPAPTPLIKEEEHPIQPPRPAEDEEIIPINPEPENMQIPKVPAALVANEEEKIEKLKQKLSRYKKIGYGLAALVLILLISTISRCSSSDVKTCPDCKREVAKDTIKCPYCDYSFE